MKRHFHLFTVSHQSAHAEVVCRTDEMDIILATIYSVKNNGAATLGVPPDKVQITNHFYLGFMDEESFNKGIIPQEQLKPVEQVQGELEQSGVHGQQV